MNEKALTSEEIGVLMEAAMKERDGILAETINEWEQHPRCALLPSPEALKTTMSSTGSDVTMTLADFDLSLKWFESLQMLNTRFYDQCVSYERGANGQLQPQLENNKFLALCNVCFHNTFEHISNTFDPEHEEVVIWYYAGHGVDKEMVNNMGLTYSASPQLDNCTVDNVMQPASKYLTTEYNTSRLKGGELCLHGRGFCNLDGLLRPWISAITDNSINKEGEKKNKHLIIILDSCFSGELVNDLRKLKEKEGPWNSNGCTVTVQAACSDNETTYGGYFTPTFIECNKPVNSKLMQEMMEEWSKMGAEQKEYFRALPLPSPVVETTLNDTSDSPTVEINRQSLKLTLFHDPGFFKFCHYSLFTRDVQEINERVLQSNTAVQFLSKKKFTVFDFKLKIMQTGPYKDYSLGLFLLDDPHDAGRAVCAHVHFAKGDTSRVGRINLLHCKKPADEVACEVYFEDRDDLFNSQYKRNRHKIPVGHVPTCAQPDDKQPDHWVFWSWKKRVNYNTFEKLAQAECTNASKSKKLEVAYSMELLNKLFSFVKETYSGDENKWRDLKNWNMEDSFYKMLRKKQRSTYMEEYFKLAKEKYSIPELHNQ